LAAYRAIGADPYSNPAPLVTISSGPTNPTPYRTATFAFSASKPNSTFECSFDGGTYVDCASPQTYTQLTIGDHSFSVRATDGNGVPGNSTTWNWAVSSLIVKVTAGPASQTSGTTATFAFAATKPVAFTCSVDGAPGTVCASPISYSSLSIGDHSFSVVGSGQSQEQSGFWSWKVVRREATITAADFSFDPAVVTVTPGGAPEWSVIGPGNHTSTDNSGMGLWDSGPMAPGSIFDFQLAGAGTYSYKCTLYPVMTGTIMVLPTALPTNGNRNTKFTIAYASEESMPGYVYDVQILRPGARDWVNWWYGQVEASLVFTADSGVGTYAFRARLTNSVTGFSSGYSGAVSIIVS
jgi:plastocyanin